jgi:hypothetical protein
MHFATFTTLFAAAAVLGAPTESTPDIANLSSEVLDQGDGFYLATYNDTGVLNVEFTPMAELKTSDPVEQVAARDTHIFARDDSNEANCIVPLRKTIALATLDEANRQLARNGAQQGHYGKDKWGWVSLLIQTIRVIIVTLRKQVHRDAETSFFCSYTDNFLTYDLIIDMHTMVSKKCGQATYGHLRRRNRAGANNLIVGRTYRGDHFCNGKVHN